MGSFDRTDSPDLALETHGVGPCACVAACYGESGVLLHCTDIDQAHQDIFEEFLCALQSIMPHEHNEVPKIFVGGLLLYSTEVKLNSRIFEQRSHILDRLGMLGFTRVEVHWCVSEMGQNVLLDVADQLVELNEGDTCRIIPLTA